MRSAAVVRLWRTLVCACCLLPQTAALGQSEAQQLVRNAADALRSGDPAEAERIATAALEEPGGSERDALWVRSVARDRLERYQEAFDDLRLAASTGAPGARTLVALGEAAFKAGDMQASIDAFDRAAGLDPGLGPHLWQRGIALYYAGRYEDGARQFEVHRTVNPQDVENSAWHFLCVAAADGLAAARAGLIPVNEDARVPMAEVLALYGGTGSAERVLEAARRAGESGRARSANLYAWLYLGLYHEALGEREPADQAVSRALEDGQPSHYMWQVARVHQILRGRRH